MKKIFKILMTSSITAGVVIPVVSCGTTKDLFTLNSVDIKNYNYVTGPYKKDRKIETTVNKNELIHGFMADAMHNYGIYNVPNNTSDKTKWEFFGNLENVIKYNNDNINLTAFKNEDVYSQLILVSKKDLKNIEIDFSLEEELKDKVEVNIFKSEFIYNTWFDENENRPWKTKFLDSNQRIADALEPISKFDLISDFLQPIFIKVKVLDEVKTEDIKVSINTKIDEKVIMKNNINIKVIGKDLGEYEVNDFSVGASPFVYSDIFKYSKRDQNDNVELNSIIDFLSDEHKSYLTPKLKSLLEHGQDYIWSWASNKSSFEDRYKNARPFDDVSSTSPKKPLDNAFLDGTHTGLVKWKNDNGKWTFDFKEYNKFISYIKELGFKKFWAGNLVFNIDIDEKENYKDQYRKIQYYQDGVLVYKNMNLNPNEKDDNFNYTKLLTEFLKAYNNNLNENKDENFETFLVYDEVNKQTVQLINDIINDNKLDNIKKHAFAGYKWSIDTDNKEEMDALLGTNNNKNSIKDLVFGGYKMQEMYPSLNDDEKAKKFREISNERRKNGLTTMMYAARSTYPSTLVQSDYGDNLWSGLNSIKLGLDGYFKWAFDKWVDNKVGEPGVGSETGSEHRPNTDPYNDGGYLNQSPAGDELLIYPNRQNKTNFVSSVRWELMHYSQQQALKLKEIDLNSDKTFEEILKIIQWPLNPSKIEDQFAVFDNYFMWDSNYDEALNKKFDKISAGNNSIIATYLINKYFEEIKNDENK